MLFALCSLAGICSGRKIQVLVDSMSMLLVIRVSSKTSLALTSIANNVFYAPRRYRRVSYRRMGSEDTEVIRGPWLRQ
jgi:hypothetical protein